VNNDAPRGAPPCKELPDAYQERLEGLFYAQEVFKTAGDAGREGVRLSRDHTFLGCPTFDADERPAIRVERRQRIQSADMLERAIAKLKETLTDIGDASMLNMIALQNALQGQQAFLQVMSNAAKARHDRAMVANSYIRDIR